MNEQTWLALKNVVVPFEWFIITGGVLDHLDRQMWHHVENITLPPFAEAKDLAGNPVYELNGKPAMVQEIVQAGSVFRGKLGRGREAIWLRDKVIQLYQGETHHFEELDRVFPDVVDAPNLSAERITLANVLRAHNLFSLEDIIDNAEGSTPVLNPAGKEIPIRAREVLAIFLSPDEIEMRIQDACLICGRAITKENSYG